MNENNDLKQSILNVWLVLLIAFALILGFVSYEVSFHHDAVPTTLREDGTLDLSELDLSQTIVEMPHDIPFYPGQLLMPEDFASGEIPINPFRSETRWASGYSFGTYHEVIRVRPGKLYMMYGYSCDYGMKLFCNGVQVIEVGTVASEPGKAVARIDEFAAPLVPDENGDLDIIIQYSNFVHNSGGSIPKWRIGEPELVNEARQQWMMATALSGGAFFAYALYFAYAAILNRSSLYRFMALMCVVFIFRNQDFFYGFLLSSSYNWKLCYKLNLIATMSEPYLLYFVFIRLLPESRFKVTPYLVGCIDLAFAALMLLMPTQASSNLCNICIGFGIMFVVIAYSRFGIALSRKKLTVYDIGLALSCVFIALCGLAETFLYHEFDFFTRSGITSFATVFFIFIIKGIVDSRHREVEQDYIRQKNIADALETQRRIRRDFLANISHEMRTPLTVISGYAQRIQLKIRKTPEMAGYEDINSGLTTISSEARRLATLVNQLLESSVKKETAIENSPVDIKEMRDEIVNLCEPILEKNGNKLSILFPEGMPIVMGNRELICQILVNITVNANRHCKGDTLLLRAEYAEPSDILLLCLEDHGDGMSKDNLENALISGFSGDGGTGLGLAICNETMRLMGGSLGLESELGVGTTVKMYFRLWNK